MTISATQTASRQRIITYAMFLAIPVALFCVFYLFSVAYTVYLSLHSWDGIAPNMRWIGAGNYLSLLQQPRFHNAVFNNIRWLLFYLLVPSTLGLSLALLVDGKLKGEGIFKVMIFLPYIITPVAVAAVWRWLYVPSGGLFNAVLSATGLGDLAQNWLGDPQVVNYAIMAAALWTATGFSFLVFFSGLRGIPYEYIEAARIDGASSWTIFWQIILPQLWPSTVLVLGLFGIDAMRIFDLVWSTSQGGPARASEVLSTQLYDVGFTTFQMGQASAIGVSQLLLAACLILPYIAYITSRVEEQTE